jgi:hypothetical protein
MSAKKVFVTTGGLGPQVEITSGRCPGVHAPCLPGAYLTNLQFTWRYLSY